MSTRIKLGLILTFVLSFAAFNLAPHHKAEALLPDQINAATYEFKNYATITMTMGGQAYDLVDKNPFDNDTTYQKDIDGCPVKLSPLRDDARPNDLQHKRATIQADKKMQVNSGAGGVLSCIPVEGGIVTVGNPHLLYTFYDWVDAGTLIDSLSGKIYKKSESLSKPGADVFLPEGENNVCSNRVIVTSDASAKSFTFHTARMGGIPSSRFPILGSVACAVQSINGVNLVTNDLSTAEQITLANQNFTLGSTSNKSKAAGTGATGTTSGPTEKTCESINANTFSWILCPAINEADDIVGTINDEVEKQLIFNEGDLGATEGTKQAWSIIRNISTIFLVLIMLVMVLSEAIGWGLFDAYAIRKTLPRLAIAVILIQISWPLFVWCIGLANDAGTGISDILFAPFGGQDAMTLNSLVAQATPDRNADGNGLFTIMTGVGLTAGALIALPAIVLFAYSAVFAVLIAFLVLIFRKVLIVACLIFAPLALAAWILPNTQKYWKLWHETFSKLLLMFPLIMAILAVGRIFAYITVNSANGGDVPISASSPAIMSTGSLGGFMHTLAADTPVPFTSTLFNYIIIIIGVFGPFILIPKTFQWSSRVLGNITGVMNDRSRGFLDRSKKGIGGYMERKQGEKANDYNPSGSRAHRMWTRARSGNVMPTARGQRLLIAQGDKWANERNDEAKALIQRRSQVALKEGFTDGNGKVYQPGVEASKAVLMEAAGNSGTSDADVRASKAAIRELLDTSSWIEIENSKITTGDNAGKRIFETDNWRAAISTSPQHYSQVIRSRPDLAPDVLDGAIKAAPKAAREAATRTATDPVTGIMDVDKFNEEYEKELPRQQQKARLMTALERMKPEDVPSIHQGLFQDIAELGDADTTALLADRLNTFATSGSPAGANAISALQGQAMAEIVNGALGHGLVKYKKDPKTGERLKDAAGNDIIDTDKSIKPMASAGGTVQDYTGRRPATTARLTKTTIDIPTTLKIAEPNTRAALRQRILTDPDTARELGYRIASGNAGGEFADDKAAYDAFLSELATAAAAMPEAKDSYNLVIDSIHEVADRQAKQTQTRLVANSGPAAPDPHAMAAADAMAAAIKSNPTYKKLP